MNLNTSFPIQNHLPYVIIFLCGGLLMQFRKRVLYSRSRFFILPSKNGNTFYKGFTKVLFLFHKCEIKIFYQGCYQDFLARQNHADTMEPLQKCLSCIRVRAVKYKVLVTVRALQKLKYFSVRKVMKGSMNKNRTFYFKSKNKINTTP